MRDVMVDRFARVVVEHCARVRPGDLVSILVDPDALGMCGSPFGMVRDFGSGGGGRGGGGGGVWLEGVYEAVVRAGGHAAVDARCERLLEILLSVGSDEQVRTVSPLEVFRLRTCDVLIVLRTQRNTRSLTRLSRLGMYQSARREVMGASLARGARGEMRYVLAEVPSVGAAQEAEMSLAEYEEWCCRAGFLEDADPVSSWGELARRHERMIEYLSGRRELRFVAPGTDLYIDVGGRTWVSGAGGENFPDGEVFTGPADVRGVVEFGFPQGYRGGVVGGIRLEFSGGRVCDARAAHNEAYLMRMLETDEGARTVGELGIGTNYRIGEYINNAFFDEKIGGTFHVALGAGYPQTGNTNQSGLHWDLVCDLRRGGEIWADGELIQKDGRFLREGWPGGGGAKGQGAR
ncbi:MAG: aminopeptidase [Phycisphaerales bacterium]|nr:aminopeptidase [Planctomycetota bacterium]